MRKPRLRLRQNSGLGKSLLKFWGEPIAFAAVAALAEGLQVAEVVGAALGQGDDVVDRQFLGGAAVLAGVVVTIENIVASDGGDFDAWGFLGFHAWRMASRGDSTGALPGVSAAGISSGGISSSTKSIDTLTRSFPLRQPLLLGSRISQLAPS